MRLPNGQPPTTNYALFVLLKENINIVYYNIVNRYSSSELRIECVIDAKQLSKQIDDYSGRLRKLDIEIQSLNFLTELA